MKRRNYLVSVIGVSLAMVHAVMATPSMGAIPSLVSPIWQDVKLLSAFGEDRGTYRHQGIDVAVTIGTPLYAVEGGKITKAAPDSKGVHTGGGHMIFIDHGDGTESRYMHLNSYAVKTGDIVEAGDLIGFSGRSGDATAPILHYEYHVFGQPVDPYFIFEAGGWVAPVEDTFEVVQQ